MFLNNFLLQDKNVVPYDTLDHSCTVPNRNTKTNQNQIHCRHLSTVCGSPRAPEVVGTPTVQETWPSSRPSPVCVILLYACWGPGSPRHRLLLYVVTFTQSGCFALLRSQGVMLWLLMYVFICGVWLIWGKWMCVCARVYMFVYLCVRRRGEVG